MTKQGSEAIRREKILMRRHYSALRKSISAESRRLLDAALFSNTASLAEFRNAKLILCYYPVKSEPNILPLIRYAMEQGKRVAFPISETNTHTLSFRQVTELSSLIKGEYGIPEPPADAPLITDFSDSFCIVPALAFDNEGHRLGYGGGYYDRFLSNYNGKSAVLAYSMLFSEILPIDTFDQQVDILITEKGGVLFDERRKKAKKE